jgi:hypothetical protein
LFASGRNSGATSTRSPGDAAYCEEFGHKLQPKSPSASPGKLSSFEFPASSVGIAPSWGMVMRLFAAALATETDTFSPLPTSLASYRDTVFLPPKADPGAEARTPHQSRHRSPRREHPWRDVDRPLHGGLRSDRQTRDPCRQRCDPEPRRREHAAKASLKASLKADLLTTTAINKEGR